MKNLKNFVIFLFVVLDELIDYQKYPVQAAEIATKARRSLGVGFIGLAHYLQNWDSSMSLKMHGMLYISCLKVFQYYLLVASNNLAKEKGHCEYFGRTKYADGILPIDTYKKDVDEISTNSIST
jgi:ribonucleoside-diphosphate reductase alpha chain